jgi:hypothetical protein
MGSPGRSMKMDNHYQNGYQAGLENNGNLNWSLVDNKQAALDFDRGYRDALRYTYLNRISRELTPLEVEFINAHQVPF